MIRVLFFAAGAVLGFGGAAVASGDEETRKQLGAVVKGAYGLKEKVLIGVETLVEDVQDSLAESKFAKDLNIRESVKKAAGSVVESVGKKAGISTGGGKGGGAKGGQGGGGGRGRGGAGGGGGKGGRA